MAPKSEAVWQALAADLPRSDLVGLLSEAEGKGVRLAYAREARKEPTGEAATIDVALSLARAWSSGLDVVGEMLAVAGRDAEDDQLWAAMAYLSTRLPEGDPDRLAWAGLARARRQVGTAVRRAAEGRGERSEAAQQIQLL